MELGNIFFGHSRGEFEFPRGGAMEDEFFRLVRRINKDPEDYYVYEYENDVFSLFPYYWGECECGFIAAMEKWSQENSHESTCYRKLIEKELVQFEKTIGWSPEETHDRSQSKKHYAYEDMLRRKYCKQFNLSYPDGCAIHCTCSHTARWLKFLENNSHKPDCLVIKPNFFYKPNGFSLMWYKYPFRDSYSNRRIKYAEFAEMIDHCMESMKKDGNIGKI